MHRNFGLTRIYLCEFRDSGGSRSIVATVMGE